MFLGLLFLDAHFRREASLSLISDRAAMVRKLQLTDLCLFTEARYTRHLSQADLHSPFQDYPMSAEHFPAGSLTRPPRQLKSAERGVRSGER
ncbi:MAG: hypothetical protein C4576_28260 [Desulfobacteraceae bacterium]|nr:MAG: hypothetical protein C4576_28260 [Desulfobacteraceae bacterium]